MFRFVVLACFLATFAAAFTTSPSMLSQSRVAAAASPLAVAPMPRVAPGAVVMSGDGEHEVLYEMFDPFHVIIVLLPFMGLLGKMALNL